MLVEFQAQHLALDLAVTAEALSTCGTVCKGFAEAREKLEYMLDAGCRYKETRFGRRNDLSFRH